MCVSQIRKEAILGVVRCLPGGTLENDDKPQDFFTNEPRFEQGTSQTQMSWERNAADCVYVQIGVSK